MCVWGGGVLPHSPFFGQPFVPSRCRQPKDSLTHSLTGTELEAAVDAAAPKRPLSLLQDVIVLGLKKLHSGRLSGRKRQGKEERQDRASSSRRPAAGEGGTLGRQTLSLRTESPEPFRRHLVLLL